MQGPPAGAAAGLQGFPGHSSRSASIECESTNRGFSGLIFRYVGMLPEGFNLISKAGLWGPNWCDLFASEGLLVFPYYPQHQEVTLLLTTIFE